MGTFFCACVPKRAYAVFCEGKKAFLKQFYVERLYKYFKGNISKYGGAHNFLEELMLSPPILINDISGTASMVDPLGIAEVVCKERDRVAIEWRQLLVEVVSR